MIVVPSYISAVGDGWPLVQCTSIGAGTVYEDIVWRGGDPLPAKAALDTWISNKIKLDMWKQIQLERDRRTKSGVLVAGNWFHTDDTSRIQQLGLVMMGANIPAGIMWKTMSGTFVEMTQTLAGQIFNAVATSDIAIFQTAEQKKIDMTASPTPETYDSYAGWPLTFGE